MEKSLYDSKIITTFVVQNIPMVINLRQNTNDDSTAFGKWFAEVDSKEPLNLKGFAKHMTSHGKIADYQMCVLVLGQVVECMSELLSQGQPVKLDGLGTFSPAVEGQGNGKNDMETAVAVGPDAMINGIKINFVPENTSSSTATWFRARSAPSTASSAACRRRRRSLTSWRPRLTETAATAMGNLFPIFEYGYVVQSEIRTVNGKQRRVQKKTPISYLMAPAADNQGNG